MLASGDKPEVQPPLTRAKLPPDSGPRAIGGESRLANRPNTFAMWYLFLCITLSNRTSLPFSHATCPASMLSCLLQFIQNAEHVFVPELGLYFLRGPVVLSGIFTGLTFFANRGRSIALAEPFDSALASHANFHIAAADSAFGIFGSRIPLAESRDYNIKRFLFVIIAHHLPRQHVARSREAWPIRGIRSLQGRRGLD